MGEVLAGGALLGGQLRRYPQRFENPLSVLSTPLRPRPPLLGRARPPCHHTQQGRGQHRAKVRTSRSQLFSLDKSQIGQRDLY